MPKVEEKMHKKTKHYGRFALAACVTIIGVMCINIFSVIAGIDIIEYISKWTSEILNTEKKPDYTVNEFDTFTSLDDLRNHTEIYIPNIKYLPDGYKFNSAEISKINEIDISFINPSNDTIDLSIMILYDDTAIEKDGDNMEIHYINGYKFKLFDNKKWKNIQWSLNDTVYYLYGDFSYDDALKIMNGIE